MTKLPRELWEEILKIKTWRAKRKRLEDILKFPKAVYEDEVSTFYLRTHYHDWVVDRPHPRFPRYIRHLYGNFEVIIRLLQVNGQLTEKVSLFTRFETEPCDQPARFRE